MNKKLLTILAVFALVMAVCIVSVSAADTTVYVSDGGTGDGTTAATPVGTLTAAANALNGEGGNIVLVGNVSITAKTLIPEQSGDLAITATNGAILTLSSRLEFAKNENANEITLDIPVNVTTSCYVFGGFNSIVFGNDFSVTGDGTVNFYGGICATDCTNNMQAVTELPYAITVNNGTFNAFTGGNYRGAVSACVGAIAAPVTITVNGGTFGTAGTYDVTAPNKTYDAFSISGMSVLADDATLTINGGTFNTPVYAVGRMGIINSEGSEVSPDVAASVDYYAVDGDIAINITGGTLNGGAVDAYYICAGYTEVMRGDYTVTVSGTPTFAAGTIFDATQVKAYADSAKSATITYPVSAGITAKRFDTVNGEAQTYTEPLRVAFIGDSITEGYAPSAYAVNRMTESYPANFLADAVADGRDVIVANYGVSASGMLPSTSRYYYDMLAYPMVMNETDADYFVFALGTNDANAAGGTNGALERFESNYTAIIEEAGALPDTEKVFITNAIYRNPTTVAALRNASVMLPIQEKVATTLATAEPDKYVFVDLYKLTFAAAENGTLLSSDNLHPAQAGYKIMGDAIYNAAFNGVTTVADFEKTDIYVSDSGTEFGTGTADSPISELSVAFAKVAAGSDVTIHVVGTVTFGGNIFVPLYANSITFVGEGANAQIVTTGDSFKLGSDTVFDNLMLVGTKANTYIMGCYNSVEIKNTVTTSGAWGLYAGYNVFADASTVESNVATYDTVASASSDKNVTVTINGGTFTTFMGGNRRFSGAAPFGVYSGTMTLTVGGNASIASSDYTGICGMNYLTGTINATINAWNGATINEYSTKGSTVAPIAHNTLMSTGTVNITLGNDVTADVVIAGDFNGDGAVSIADVILMLRYTVNGFDATKTMNNYGEAVTSLVDVLHAMKKLAA